jgi:hypothetical protein
VIDYLIRLWIDALIGAAVLLWLAFFCWLPVLVAHYTIKKYVRGLGPVHRSIPQDQPESPDAACRDCNCLRPLDEERRCDLCAAIAEAVAR